MCGADGTEREPTKGPWMVSSLAGKDWNPERWTIVCNTVTPRVDLALVKSEEDARVIARAPEVEYMLKELLRGFKTGHLSAIDSEHRQPRPDAEATGYIIARINDILAGPRVNRLLDAAFGKVVNGPPIPCPRCEDGVMKTTGFDTFLLECSSCKWLEAI